MEGEISELKALTRTGNASRIERSIIKIPPRHTRHSGPPEGQDASPRSRQWTRQQDETQDNRSVSISEALRKKQNRTLRSCAQLQQCSRVKMEKDSFRHAKIKS